MRTSNPVLSDNAFQAPSYHDLGAMPTTQRATGVMTVQGTVNAAFILISLCSAAAVGAWMLISAGTVPVPVMMLGGILGGLVLALVITFVPKTAPYLAPIYAILEGAALAGISFVAAQALERKAPGLGGATVFQAVLVTLGIFIAMLVAYTSGLLRARGWVGRCIMVGTAGVAVFYLATMLLNMFGVTALNTVFQATPIGIAFSVFVVALASFNLIMDFQFIEDYAATGTQPKYMEWFGAFGLLVTLVWLYIEVLRLLSKLRSR
jgi:uncharacterized YccA/Bax inhibitor family protein